MVAQVPLARLSLEGRLQRQLVLYEHGLCIKDPMDFFEEITRYKISKGILPMELLYLPDQLDALAAAYIARLAVKKEEDVFAIGDTKEGMVVLPGRELKEKY
jgi:predicted RNase H-like nuclease